ncbi:uncharacterized protein LOC118415366 [Branchiostoma floridae]|uniref:Uncharacterized protein LOC118415366 n=1 Tax=Branchiostoma floridae TaxID=7739 RepID=A0A9J7L4J4_BRAFL|nr:uncharacterized protein LOC118415366 [Branchiostoma floridae]
MKVTLSVLFLACVVLAAAIPAPREEGLQGLLTEIKDMVAGIEEQLDMEMGKRDQADEDEDLEAEAEDLQEMEMEKRGRAEWLTCYSKCQKQHSPMNKVMECVNQKCQPLLKT